MQSLDVQDMQGDMEIYLHPSWSSDMPRYAQGSTGEEPMQPKVASVSFQCAPAAAPTGFCLWWVVHKNCNMKYLLLTVSEEFRDKAPDDIQKYLPFIQNISISYSLPF